MARAFGEQMDRMGHSTTRAALLYLQGNDERLRAVADAMSDLAKDALTGQRPRRSGTQRARDAGRLRDDRHRGCHPAAYLRIHCAPRPRLERGTYCLGDARSACRMVPDVLHSTSVPGQPRASQVNQTASPLPDMSL